MTSMILVLTRLCYQFNGVTTILSRFKEKNWKKNSFHYNKLLKLIDYHYLYIFKMKYVLLKNEKFHFCNI